MTGSIGAIGIAAALIGIRAAADFRSGPERGVAFLLALVLIVTALAAIAAGVYYGRRGARLAVALTAAGVWASVLLLLPAGHAGFLAAADLTIALVLGVAAALLWTGRSRAWFDRGRTMPS